MKPFYLLLFIAIFNTACEKNEINSNCDLSEEVTIGLSIVLEEIEQYSCHTNVYSGKYRNLSVYITAVEDPVCLTDGSVGLYDCSGEFIGNKKPGKNLRIGNFLADNN